MVSYKDRIFKEDAKAKVKKLLGGQGFTSYILITCQEMTEEGKMQVEMTYEGDAILASYLIDNAQEFFDHELTHQQSSQTE